MYCADQPQLSALSGQVASGDLAATAATGHARVDPGGIGPARSAPKECLTSSGLVTRRNQIALGEPRAGGVTI
jgi:hypothetical protein